MRPRASFPSIDKLRPQKANKLCVSLGLGQFLDRIAVQEQDRKFEPFFGFSARRADGEVAQYLVFHLSIAVLLY